MKIDICCIARDELDLPEWAAFHKVVGISHITIYDNQSQTPIKTSLKRYVEEGFVSVVDWPGNGDVQMQAYDHYIGNYAVAGGWTAYIDADEHLTPRVANTVEEVLKDYEKPGIGAFNVSWQIFGSSGHIERPSGLVVENYTHIIPHDHYESTHTKAIVRNDFVVKAGSNPHCFIYRTGSFAMSENYWIVSSAWTPHCSEKLVLNHYCVKSQHNWRQKIAKPRADTSKYPGKTMADFDKFDVLSTKVDESALRFVDSVKTELTRIA